MKDLVVLTADKDCEYALKGLLSRPQALGIRSISVEYLRHPNKDPGCRMTPETLLRSQARRFRYALVMFDREGSGENQPGTGLELERDVIDNLSRNGWDGRSRCVVIEPELEAWVWSDSPQVDECLDWTGRQPSLRAWLKEKGWLEEEQSKPSRPKEAMEAALKMVGKPLSSSNFEELAKAVSFRRCEDEAFGRLLECLRTWFPIQSD